MRFRIISMALGLAAMAMPALATHNTPLKANKFLSLFVRAYNACNNPSTTHNSPLAFPACTPFETGTTLKFGPKGFGQAKGTVKVNSLKQATDVALQSKFIDVRNPNDTGFSGNLLVSSIIRTTDHYCVTPGQPCTLIDIPFPVGLPCGTAAVPPLPAGKCLSNTSANTAVPGAVVPGYKANVEIQQLTVALGVDVIFSEGLFLP